MAVKYFAGREVKEREMRIGSGDEVTTKYTYNADGSLFKVVVGDAKEWEYRYGEDGQLVGIKTDGNYKTLNYDQNKR